MIRVILQGRTGNNLFQYAAGRALAERHQTSLVLDGSWVNPAQARIFENLLRLPIKARYENRRSFAKRLGRKFFSAGPGSFHRGPLIIDPENGTLPELTAAPDHTLLIGFFQSPLHFTGMEEKLRSELDLTTLRLPTDSLRFEEELRRQTTASIHVRRGDYLGISSTQCLDENYHSKAINWLRERHTDLRFCVFSDDIPWCRTHFRGPEFLFANFSAASEDPFHDMRLMASCHHHIIVNSSYSWWGAWLNRSTNNQVIAPKMWMLDLSSENIVPVQWNLM